MRSRKKRQLTKKKQRKKTSTLHIAMNEQPSFITVRTITYGKESERFLVRMGGEEQARLMSELPPSLEGFHKRVTRYYESHSETFFKELKEFVAEEIRRKELAQKRPGELFLFYKSSEIVVTDKLGEKAIDK